MRARVGETGIRYARRMGLGWCGKETGLEQREGGRDEAERAKLWGKCAKESVLILTPERNPGSPCYDSFPISRQLWNPVVKCVYISSPFNKRTTAYYCYQFSASSRLRGLCAGPFCVFTAIQSWITWSPIFPCLIQCTGLPSMQMN